MIVVPFHNERSRVSAVGQKKPGVISLSASEFMYIHCTFPHSVSYTVNAILATFRKQMSLFLPERQ